MEAWVASTARFRDGTADCTADALAAAAADLCTVAAAAPPLASSGVSRYGPVKLMEMMRPQAEGARNAASPRVPASKKRKGAANEGEVWDELLRLESGPLVPPADAKTFREAIAWLDAWLASFPAQFLHGKGPAAAKGMYQRKLICRKFAWSMARRMPPDELQGTTAADLMPTNADMQGYVAAAFPGTASWAEIQRATGVPPLLLGGWCCLMSGLLPARLEQLENASAKVIDVIARLSTDLGRAPSLADVAAGLCE